MISFNYASLRTIKFILNKILHTNIWKVYILKEQNAFSKLSQNLDEYIFSAEANDEQTYRDLFIHKECPMAFVQHQPLGGDFNVYRSRMGNSIGADEDITNPSTFLMYP